MAKQEAVVVLTAKDKASKVLGQVGGSLKGLGRVLTSTTAQLIGVGSLTFAFTAATMAAIDFQKGVTEIKTLGIEKSIAEITKEVDGLTRQFGGKPQATIKAYYDAISAGVKESRVVEFLSEASKLALAGATDVSIATDILTGLRATFKETDASLAATVNATKNLGKVTVEQLRKIGTAAPFAAELGVSVQELGASIATATIVIGNADKTLGGLRAAFAAVLKPSAEALEVADRLEIDFSAAAVATKGWVPFLAELSEKVKGNTTDLFTLFGSVEAFNVVTVLAKDNAQGLADSFEGVRKEIETGAFERAAEAMKDTAAVRLDILRAEITSVANNLTLQLLPAITDVAKGLVDIIKLKTGEVFKQEFAAGVDEAGAKVRQLEDEVTSLSDTINSALLPVSVATKNRLKDLEGQLAKANLEFREAALGATDFDDRLVALANKLMATGQPAVAAYDGALRQLRGQLLLEKESADAAAEAEKEAAEVRSAAAQKAREEEEVAAGKAKELAGKRAQLEADLIKETQRLQSDDIEFRRQMLDQEVADLVKAFGEKTEAIEEFEAAKTEAIEEAEEERAALEEERAEAKEERESKEGEDRIARLEREAQARQQVTDSIIATGGALAGTLAQAFGGEKKAAKVGSLITRIQEIIAAKRDFAAALTFSAPPPNLLFSPPAAAGLFISGAQHLAAAAFAGKAKFAAGGFVPQLPGASANSDSVLAALTPGELVIPKPFAQEVSNVLGRSGQGGRFQEGGVVGAEGLPEAVGGTVNVTVLPAEPSVLGPLLDAMNEAVERFGFRMVASEVTS